MALDYKPPKNCYSKDLVPEIPLYSANNTSMRKENKSK